jgi:hypothetical protein
VCFTQLGFVTLICGSFFYGSRLDLICDACRSCDTAQTQTLLRDF